MIQWLRSSQSARAIILNNTTELCGRGAVCFLPGRKGPGLRERIRPGKELFAMRWDEFRRSENVEDARGGGFTGRVPGGAGGLGIGGLIILALIGWALGIDPSVLIGSLSNLNTESPSRNEAPNTTGTPGDRTGQFVSAVLGDTEDRWKALFEQNGETYRPPKLRLFSGADASACGFAQAAMGPFYCPNDEHIYLDTSFFQDLETRFHGCTGKACEFAQAYVITHEVGHHVQNLLGILPKARRIQTESDHTSANDLQVQIELQADCLAGVWAHHSQEKWKFIEPGDVEAAMQTAAAIGDDRLQRRSQGYVVPDAFTHGSSAQRVRWFTTGLKSGTFSSCNTFEAARQ
jgi:predicted metalloprotease